MLKNRPYTCNYPLRTNYDKAEGRKAITPPPISHILHSGFGSFFLFFFFFSDVQDSPQGIFNLSVLEKHFDNKKVATIQNVSPLKKVLTLCLI